MLAPSQTPGHPYSFALLAPLRYPTGWLYYYTPAVVMPYSQDNPPWTRSATPYVHVGNPALCGTL